MDKQQVNKSWHRGAEIFFIMVIFFILGGSPTPGVNEAHYLAKAKHFWNPSWCSGDHFLETADAHYVFHFTIGWLTQFFSLDATAWIGRISGWLLLAFAWQRLIWCIVPKFGAAILSAGLWVTLMNRFHMSGEWVVGGIEGKVLGYGFVLLGLKCLVEKNWHRVWPLLGIASSFHVLAGGWSVVAAMIAWTMEQFSGGDESQQNRIPFRHRFLGFFQRFMRMLPFLVLGGVLALPGLLPVLFLSHGVPIETVKDGTWYYVFRRLQHHLVFRSFPYVYVVRFGLLAAAWGVISFAFFTSNRYRRLSRFGVGAFLILTIGIASDLAIGDTYTAASVLRFYWFRLADVAIPLVASVAVIDILNQGARFRVFRRISDALPHPRSTHLDTSGSNPLQLTLTVLIAALTLLSISESFLSQSRPLVPLADRQGKITHHEKLADWLEVCDWVTEHVSPAVRILAPPNHATFKWHTGHPEVVNWKDVPQDPDGIVQWHQRLKDVRRFLNTGHEKSSSENITDLRNLADKYEFDYLILDKQSYLVRLPGSRVLENRSYIIYSIE